MAWHKHHGGPMPVNPDSLVRVQIRARTRADAEKQEPRPAKSWRWDHRNNCGDVVAFEQVGERAA